MDAYTIGLVYIALALIKKIIDLLTPAVVAAVLVLIVIAVIGRRKK